MPGKIKEMIDAIIAQRSNGNSIIAANTRVKLALKGILPDKYDSTSEDDYEVIDKLRRIAKELNLSI